MRRASELRQNKEKQAYTDKYIAGVCGNCHFFMSDKVADEWGYIAEKNMRCRIGGFKVKKGGSCAEHRFKD